MHMYFHVLCGYSVLHAGSEVVTGGTTQLHDVPILGLYQTPNDGQYSLLEECNSQCFEDVHVLCTCVCTAVL